MIPARLGPYRILSELGTGGMGTVYLAVVDGVVSGVGVGEQVALKLLRADLVRDGSSFEQFVSEAAIGRRIRHDNVVRTLDAGMDFDDDGERVYLAMEYVVGRTLASVRKDAGGRLAEGMCRRVAREVARGLQGIHEWGVVHGDLKPENVLVTRDEVVKVMDLGLARLRGMSLRSTGAAQFEGTFLYAAPEQFSEGTRAIDARADLYALGVSLFELIAGVHPFAHDDMRVVMHRHLHDPPPRLSDVAPDTSPFLAAVVAQLLAKDPDHRFRSASELLAVLSRGEDSTWWRRRKRALAVVASESVGGSVAPSVAGPVSTRLHGREEELVTLLHAFDDAADGSGAAVVVSGEPGIGKSRLVEELIALLAQRDPAPAVLSARIDDAVTAASLATSPTLVSIDDADQATESELAALAREHSLIATRPVLLVVSVTAFAAATFSPLAQALPRALRVHLPRLSSAPLADLIEDVLEAGRAPPELIAWVTRWSDGNPKLATELVRDLRDGRDALSPGSASASGQLEMTADGAWRSVRPLRERRLPASVRQFLAHRIESLPTADREFLDAAACAGAAFGIDVLAAVLGEDVGAVAIRLGVLVRAGIVWSADGQRFTFASRALHAVAHDLVQDMLRPEYHRMFADAVLAQAGSPPDGRHAATIVRHHLAAGDSDLALDLVAPALSYLAAEKRWDDLLDLAMPALAALDRAAAASAARDAAAAGPVAANAPPTKSQPESLRRLRVATAAARAHLALGRPDAAAELLTPK